jgi:hypothetical protein
VRAERLEGVGEAVDLGEREFVFRPSADDDASAGGAEIDGSAVQ